MKFDQQRVDDATLALLYLVTFNDHGVHRAWKGFDWDTMERLHQAGFIDDPVSKNKSVGLTEDGAKKSAELFRRWFGAQDSGSPDGQ
jgi:hypothetical protein